MRSNSLFEAWDRYSKFIGFQSLLIAILAGVNWIYGTQIDTIIILFVSLVVFLLALNMNWKLKNEQQFTNKLYVNVFELMLLYIFIMKGIVPLVSNWAGFSSNWHIAYRFVIIFGCLIMFIGHMRNFREIKAHQGN